MKRKFDIKKQWLEVLLLLLLAFEFAFIIWINVFHITDTIDEDFAGMVTHTLEIARTKRLLLENWFYPTTGEFDTSLLFALFIFAVTRNIYLSFALVNILNAALIGYVFYRVLRLAGSCNSYALTGMCIALAAYDFGMLDYTNMLFFGGSQYVYKAVMPLLFMAVLFSKKPEKILGDKRLLAESLIFYALFFLTSFSSGIYEYLCGIFPIIICCFVIGIYGDKVTRKDLVIHCMAATVVALVGVFFHKINHLEIHSFNSDLLNLRYEMQFTAAFNDVFDKFVQVIDPVAKEPIEATTFIGICGSFKWIMVLLVCLGLFFIPRAFGFELIRRKEKSASVREYISICGVSVFLFNFIIMLITTSETRYHLVGFFPLAVCAVIFLEDFLKGAGIIIEKSALLAVFAMYVCLLISNFTYHAPRYFAKEGVISYYLDEEFASKIKEYADNYGVETVFFVNVIEDAEIMRLYDTTHSYQTYRGLTAEVINYDSYIIDRDKSRFGDRNIIAVSEEGYDTLKSYITDNYQQIGHEGKYDIMISDFSPMDGGTFIYRGEKTIDLPVSPGYEYAGDVGSQGYLFSANEGDILSSPEIKADIPFTYTLNYDVNSYDDSTEFRLDVYRNGQLHDSTVLETGDHRLSLDLEGRNTYSFILTKNGNGIITVREIEFEGK